MPGHRHIEITRDFVVIDGPDGGGKTTQIKMLRDTLPHRYERPHEDFVFTREPGGTPFAERIRNEVVLHEVGATADGVEMVLAYNAARFNNLRTLIIPALQSGKVVVTDRFDAITLAYQIFAQENQVAGRFFELAKQELEGMLRAAGFPRWHTIILDVPVEVTAERLAKRAREGGVMNHFDRRSPEFYARAREGFHHYAEAYGPTTTLIDATRTPCQVHHDVIAVFDQVLSKPA
jgi:dTMP kinase